MQVPQDAFDAVDPGPVIAGEVQFAEAAVATLFDLPLACGSEGMRFLGRRWQAEAEHMGKLLRCRSMPEVAVEQVRYVGAAAYDCCDGVGTLIARAGAALVPAAPPPPAD